MAGKPDYLTLVQQLPLEGKDITHKSIMAGQKHKGQQPHTFCLQAQGAQSVFLRM
jgi:hypothetical protein